MVFAGGLKQLERVGALVEAPAPLHILWAQSAPGLSWPCRPGGLAPYKVPKDRGVHLAIP